MAQLVKNLPAMPETWVEYLGWEDLLEKGRATQSSILACIIPWTEKSGRLYSLWGHKESDTTERLSLSSRATVHLELLFTRLDIYVFSLSMRIY